MYERNAVTQHTHGPTKQAFAARESLVRGFQCGFCLVDTHARWRPSLHVLQQGSGDNLPTLPRQRSALATLDLRASAAVLDHPCFRGVHIYVQPHTRLCVALRSDGPGWYHPPTTTQQCPAKPAAAMAAGESPITAACMDYVGRNQLPLYLQDVARSATQLPSC